MSENKDVTKTSSGSAQKSVVQQRAIRPMVDVFEDKSGITIQADMPGVARDRLDIQIDNDSLSIEGRAELSMPEGMEALYADVRSTLYQRSFSLSSELDGAQTEANLKDGVLTLHIPKREQYKPRKIEVRTA